MTGPVLTGFWERGVLMLENHDRQNAPERHPEDDPKTIRGSQKQLFRLVVRAACALYLIYLGVKLFRGVTTGEAVGTIRIVSIISSVVFCAVAVVLLGNCLQMFLRSLRESGSDMEPAPEEEKRETAREEATREEDGYGYLPLQDDEKAGQAEDPDDPDA